MFFIFGFGKQTIKTTWSNNDRTCPRCNNTKKWPYKKITYWFTLFFIPIIPYKVVYLTVCPICGYYEEISAQTFENGHIETVDPVMPQGEHSKPGMTEIQKRFNQEMATYEKHRHKDPDD